MTQRRFNSVGIAVALLAALLEVCACKDPDEKVFKGGSNVEMKPKATLLGTLKDSSGLGGADATDVSVTASVTYTILVDNLTTLTPKPGISTVQSADDGDPTGGVCSGEFAADVMSNFTFQFPVAKIQCVGLTIDVAKILNGGLGVAAGTNSDFFKNLKHDGKVLSTSSLLNATFTPERPLLLGPIVQDATKYQGFKQSYSTTVAGSLNGKTYNAPGQFDIEVLDVETKYSNDLIKNLPALDKILHWRMTASGFDGVPMLVGGLLPSLELYWNVVPLMIPKIIVQAEGEQLLNGFIADGGGANVGKIAGRLIITARVKDFKLK